MQIAILHYAAPPIIGGVEATIYHHARLLTGAGHKVRVIAGRAKDFHPQVPIHRLPAVDSRHEEILVAGESLAAGTIPDDFEPLKERLLSRLSAALDSVDVLIAHNIATLHKNLPLTAALHQLASQAPPITLAWSHDFAWRDELYESELHDGYPWDLLRTAWPGVRYVTVSHHRRTQLSALFGLPEEEISVVPPGVEVQDLYKLDLRTKELARVQGFLHGEPLILLPARITRRKNIQFAIRVIAALRENWPSVKLIVTGPPGPHNPANRAYLDSLQDLRSQMDLQERVLFLYELGGRQAPLYITDAMMADFFQLADLLFFPSLREGFGIPALEAGLFRLPIFASDIPPIRESTRQYGHFFDPRGDPEDVAGQMDRFLCTDSAFQMRRRVLANYTWPAILDRYLLPLLEGLASKASEHDGQ